MGRMSLLLLAVALAVAASAVAAQPQPTSSSSSSAIPSASSNVPPAGGSLYWYTYCSASNSTGAVWTVSASGFLSLNLSAGVPLNGEWTGYPLLFINGTRQWQDYLTGAGQTSAIVGLSGSAGDGASADQLLRQTFAGWSPDSAGISLLVSPAASGPFPGPVSRLLLTNGEYVQDATSLIVENGYTPNGRTQFLLQAVNASFVLPQSCQQLPPLQPQPTSTIPAPPAVVSFNWTYCAASNTSVGGAWAVSASGSLLVNNSAIVSSFHSLQGQANGEDGLLRVPARSVLHRPAHIHGLLVWRACHHVGQHHRPGRQHFHRCARLQHRLRVRHRRLLVRRPELAAAGHSVPAQRARRATVRPCELDHLRVGQWRIRERHHGGYHCRRRPDQQLLRAWSEQL